MEGASPGGVRVMFPTQGTDANKTFLSVACGFHLPGSERKSAEQK